MSTCLVTVSDVQAYGATQSTALIQTSLDAVWQSMEGYCDRQFTLAKHVDTPANPDEIALELIPGSGDLYLRVKRPPIVSIQRIRINGETVAASEYSIADADEGKIYRRNGWPREILCANDLTADPLPDQVLPTIDLAYHGGWTAQTLPADLKRAVIQEVLGDLARPKDGTLVEERTPGGYSYKRAGAQGTAPIRRFLVGTYPVLMRYARTFYDV